MKTLTYALLITAFGLSTSLRLAGQEKVNISAGIGLPELLYLGARYQLNQAQIGLGVGSFPAGSGEKILSVSGDFYLHFGGTSEWSNRRPWYGRVGLNYLRDETDRLIDKYLYLNLRVGRDFNLSRRLGVTLDLGPAFQLANEETRKEPSSGWFNLDFEFPVIPGMGVGVFYRVL